MQGDFHRSTFARIGRSYPRPLPPLASAERSWPRRIPAHLRLIGALIALLSALGLIGWYLAR
ncbi:MAG TPA: hypothetical protein VGJ74_08845 [Burkholderiales bacterium]|jgi:hypothetical protein